MRRLRLPFLGLIVCGPPSIGTEEEDDDDDSVEEGPDKIIFH